MKKHLEESNKEVEKKENDTKQSSSVNTGVETQFVSNAALMGIAALGVIEAKKRSKK